MKTVSILLLLLSALLPTSGYEVLADGTLKSDTMLGSIAACVHELSGDEAMTCLAAAVSL